MMTRLKRLLYYWRVYQHLFQIAIKTMVTYRLNFIARMLYGPSYVLVMFFLIKIAFSKAPMLGGWTAAEGLLLFTVFQLGFSLSRMIFLQGLQLMVERDIRFGMIDLVLTKPINAQFLLTFGRPSLNQFLMALIMFIYLVQQLWVLQPALIDLLSFIGWFGVSIVLSYLTVSTFSVLGFYVTKAVQVIDLYYKVSDFAQYPNTIFPDSIQAISLTILPIAFFGYIPTQFLLGRGDPVWIIYVIALTHLLFTINQWAWKQGFKQYASASS